MTILQLMLVAIFIVSLQGLAVANQLRTKVLQQCPNMKKYEATLDYFLPRLQNQGLQNICDKLPVYHAFKDAGFFLDKLEEDNNQLMDKLANLMQKQPKLADLIHKNSNLAEYLILQFNNELKSKNIINALESINKADPYFSILTLIFPDLPSKSYLELQNNHKLSKMFVQILNNSLRASNEELAPAIAVNSTDTIDIYHSLINLWGMDKLEQILDKTPNVLGVLLPPMQWREMFPYVAQSSYDPKNFATMQEDYMQIQRKIYLYIENQWGSAWAEEASKNFVQPLYSSLYAIEKEELDAINIFIRYFLGKNAGIFKKLIRPSNCKKTTNLEFILGFLNDKSSLKTLGLWYKDSRGHKANLAYLLEKWADSTSATDIPATLEEVTNIPDSLEEQKRYNNSLFWENLPAIAKFRQNELATKDRQLLDNIILNLNNNYKEELGYILAFMVLMQRPLFKQVMQNRFEDKEAVAMRLLTFGYPTSEDPNVYEYFKKNYLDKAYEALRERGRLAEQDLMQHGLTFKDRFGLKPVEIVTNTLEIADYAINIAYFASAIASAGLTAPTGAILLPIKSKIKNIISSTAKKLLNRPLTEQELELIAIKSMHYLIKKVNFVKDKLKPWSYADHSFSGRLNNSQEIFDMSLNLVKELSQGETILLNDNVNEYVQLCPQQ